ncbi:hypothetical protein DUZ99_02560 [Xylanibacillus composti]|uniref:Uncharacterized protein n=1 Tax=Xylanibacillus composti TaxID=1572762 RepID=A0A8J4H248_9BACL|nr:hypothetical protein [Xylanibacillus composti]MDT9723878.1 hypothetical protein [Xylanibacillus composti]GIQ67343.1 hypothetical protein XYCOK13_01670 [Xylanibacillus composti]
MSKKFRVSAVMMLIVVALSLSLGGSAAPATYVHGIFSERALYVVDGLTGDQYPVRGNAIASWTEHPLQSGNQAFFNAIVHNAAGDRYEFRLVSLGNTTNDSIYGKFDIYKNYNLVAQVTGTAYGLSLPVGNYYKFYDSQQNWHVSGYITDRLDY